MAMHTWFECKIRYEKVMENGMQKKVTEPYLVDALSFTEAEARIIEEMTPFISGEFTVSDIKRANYSELFPSDEESADRWFKCKLIFITLDEKSGAEKKTSTQVLVQAAYDEQVPVTEMQAYSICSTCGADITGNTSAHVKNHVMIGDDKGGYHTEWRETVVGYKTVHHDAVYETRYVVDSPATTKQELTGYKCSGCGKTKAN